MRHSRMWPATALVLLGTAMAGCSQTAAPPPGPQSGSVAPSKPAAAATESNPPGDIPDNQAFVPYTPSGSAISVKVPEGWARSNGARSTIFADKLNRIEISFSPATSAPSISSVTRVDVPALQSSVPKFMLGKVSNQHRSAGTVVVVTYQGDSEPDKVTGKVVRDAFERYIYFNKGQRVDLTLSGPTNADNVDPWRIVSDSVHWL